MFLPRRAIRPKSLLEVLLELELLVAVSLVQLLLEIGLPNLGVELVGHLPHDVAQNAHSGNDVSRDVRRAGDILEVLGRIDLPLQFDFIFVWR